MNVVTYLAIPHYTRTNTHNTPLAICVKILLIAVVWTHSFLLGSYFHTVTFRKRCESLEYAILRSWLCVILFHRISDSTFIASDPSACFGRTTFETKVVVQRSRNISQSGIRIRRRWSIDFGYVPYNNIFSARIRWSSYSKHYRKKCNDNIFLREQNRQQQLYFQSLGLWFRYDWGTIGSYSGVWVYTVNFSFVFNTEKSMQVTWCLKIIVES